MGSSTRSSPPSELHDRALAQAAESPPRRRTAQALAKRAIDAGLDVTLDGRGLGLEQQLFAEEFATDDALPSASSRFLEHGDAGLRRSTWTRSAMAGDATPRR